MTTGQKTTTGEPLRCLLQLVLFLGVVGLNEASSLDAVLRKNGEGFQFKTNSIGDASQPADSSDLDWLEWSCSRPDTSLPTTLAFPDGSHDIVDICEGYAVVWSANQTVQLLSLPLSCTGHHLSNGTASLIIACSSEAHLLELYKKEDGRYAIDEDEVFSTSGATTIARVGSGFMYTRNGLLMHKVSINNGDSPQQVTIVAILDCGTPYPMTFTDTHILLECSNGKWYLCPKTGGDCSLLSLPLFAKIAPSPTGTAAVLSSSTLTIYSNDFNSNCPPVTLEDSNVTLHFFQDKVFIKGLNTFHYVTTSPCSEPTLLDTFVGVPQCFTGDCTDYVTSDRYLAITTMDGNLAEVLTYNITTMEKLDYSVRYHSVPILYNIVERATIITSSTSLTISSTAISSTISSTAISTTSTITSSAMTSSSRTSTTNAIPSSMIRTTSSVSEPFKTEHIIVISVAVVVLCMVVLCIVVVVLIYRLWKRRKLQLQRMPVQVHNDGASSSMSSSSSSLPSIAMFQIPPPIQATEP